MLTTILALYGGLGLFIYGLQFLSESLQRAAGDRFRVLLERLTGTPIKGLSVGVLVTALVQSSSATTVMVVGLVNAGLMTLVQAAGVIFGANIGTTITGQLVAFKLTDYALPMIGLGFTLSFFGKRRTPKRAGEILLGLGLLFLGMKLMSQYLSPLLKQPWAANLILQFSAQPLLGVLVGAALTGIVQSSSATTGLVIALGAEGAISLYAAVPLILGANIGTCATALLASIGSSLMARRAAVVHLLFNVIGVVIALPFLGLFEGFVQHLGTEVPRQIANAHTVFNVGASLLLLPFVGHLTRLARVIVPGETDSMPSSPRLLDKRLLNTPSVAIAQGRKEAVNMARFALDSLHIVFDGLLRNDASVNAQIVPREQAINGYERSITDYLMAISAQDLSQEDSRRVANTILAVKDLERVGDHAESIARLVSEKAEDNIGFSDEAAAEIREMFAVVDRAMQAAMKVLTTGGDEQDALRDMENQLDEMEKELRGAHIRRLTDRTCSAAAGIIFLDVASHFERIGDHAANIGRLMNFKASE